MLRQNESQHLQGTAATESASTLGKLAAIAELWCILLVFWA
jgi:hypothetical protein